MLFVPLWFDWIIRWSCELGMMRGLLLIVVLCTLCAGDALRAGGAYAQVGADGAGGAAGTLPLRAPPQQQSSAEFSIVGPPTVSMETYRTVYCQPRHGRVSAACPYAPQMYQMLVDAGVDPAIELAFAAKETEFGTTGPGRSPQHNLHNLVCNGWDGGTCEGPYSMRFSTYPDYLHGLYAWIVLLTGRGTYVDAGRVTFRQVIPVYAPAFENDTALYIAQVETWVRGWRSWDNIQHTPVAPIIWGAGIRQPLPALGDSRVPIDRVQPAPDVLDNPQVPQQAIAVDNSDPGFSANQNTWNPESCGLNGEHVVADTTSDVALSSSRVSWLPRLTDAGTYEVLAYIPGCNLSPPTRSAAYVVTHDYGETSMVVDQTQHAGTWVSLGTYTFGGRFNPMVEVSNLTQDNERAVLVDVVAWVPRPEVQLTPPPQQAAASWHTSWLRNIPGVNLPLPPDDQATAPGRVPLPEAVPTSLPPTHTPVPMSPNRVVPSSIPTPIPSPRPTDTPLPTEAPTAPPLPTAPPTLLPATPAPAATPPPAETILARRVVGNGGNLRSEPHVVDETVLAQVCPWDEVDILATLEVEGHSWVRVRVVTTPRDCHEQRAAAGSEGWISATLLLDEDETAGDE